MIDDGSDEEYREQHAGIVCVLVRTKKKKRKAKDVLEEWAGRALHHLFINNLFRESDKEFGDSLSVQLNGSGKLSEAQWEHALKLARRYQEHVSVPPDPRQQDLFASDKKGTK